MSKFESSISSKNFGTTQMRNLVIPDETESDIQRFSLSDEESLELERKIQHDKDLKMNKGVEKISEGAKKRIEILIGMTTSTKEIDVSGVIFKVKVLSSKDVKDAILHSYEEKAKYKTEVMSNYNEMFELRRQIIARAVLSIGELSFSDFIASNDLNDKLSFVDQLDESALTKIYTDYNTLSKESSDKYEIKTKEQVEEVAQDIKK